MLSISPSSGLVEVVPDSSSIDALKKGNGCLSLARHFENTFGSGSAAHDRAVSAYISSLAGYVAPFPHCVIVTRWPGTAC